MINKHLSLLIVSTLMIIIFVGCGGESSEDERRRSAEWLRNLFLKQEIHSDSKRDTFQFPSDSKNKF